jgi:hypothetical protein
VARRDWVTIRKHVAALRRFSPDLIPAYKELVRLMVSLAGYAFDRELRKALKA